jgi:hypothetical protein
MWKRRVGEKGRFHIYTSHMVLTSGKSTAVEVENHLCGIYLPMTWYEAVHVGQGDVPTGSLRNASLWAKEEEELHPSSQMRLIRRNIKERKATCFVASNSSLRDPSSL